VTVAGCPSWTLLMSDSLKATVIVSVSVLMISANPELVLLDEDDPEPPRLPAVEVPPVPDVPLPDEPEPEDDDDELDEDDPEPPAETVSPGVRLEREAIVPLTGAYSLVLLTAISAVWTAACALYTAAWAEARLLGEGVAVVVVVWVELVFGAELPPLEADDPLVLGTTTVTVTLGVVFVILVPDLVGVAPDPAFGVPPDPLVGVPPDPVVGFLVLPDPDVDPGSYDAYSTVPAELGVKLVVLADPEDPDPEDPDPDEPDPDEPDPEPDPPDPPDPQFAVV
jgi:hypothetical protein